jgi:hypothetical protein
MRNERPPGEKAGTAQKAKVIAVSFALVLEWALAFRLAKAFARAVADAQADSDADAFANVLELRHRLTQVEHAHGREWSVMDEDYREWPTILDDGQVVSMRHVRPRPRPPMVD